LNADLSVAPEIAQLAAPFVPLPPSRENAAPHTDGRRAGQLSELAAAPQRWWDLVRFDPGAPVRVPVPGTAGAWLVVLPPGAVIDCDCGYATLLAGEAAEAGRPLRAGRVRVHGGGAPHRLLGAGHGYSVSLHYAGRPGSPGITPGE
jgi:hypothetical protein